MRKCWQCKIIKPLNDFNKNQDRCRDCGKIYFAAYRAANKEKEKIRHANYHVANKEKINKRVSEWQKSNPERVRKKSRKFYHRHRDKERARCDAWQAKNPDWNRENTRKWRAANLEYRRMYDDQYWRNNKDKVYSKNAKRRALKNKAIASWANLEKIKAIYAESIRLTNETGIPHVVDHIIPLNSKYICGLHCENNLQVITASENSIKHNKFSPYSF